jgi:KaiC/GvpD/RAD55 family RecA-like ATPase
MPTTTWQHTPEWEPDPLEPREQLITIAIDTARNGEPILLVTDEQTDRLLAGAATRSQFDLHAALDCIATQLERAVLQDRERRAEPVSRLINRPAR